MSRFVMVVPEPVGPVVRRFDSVEKALKVVVRQVQHMGAWGFLPGDEGTSIWRKKRSGWEKLA